MNRNTRKVSVLLLCVVYLLTVLTPVWAETKKGGSPTRGTLTGKVTAVSGSPIAGATITAVGSGSGTFSAATDADGLYTLTAPAGYYTVSCEAAGYNKNTLSANISNNRTTTLNITLVEATPANGTIYGTVYSADTDEPIAGAVVTTSSGSYITTTNGTGEYLLTNVTPGTYSLSASADNSNPEVQDVTVNAGSRSKADFRLAPISSAAGIKSLTASTASFIEGTAEPIVLTAELTGSPAGYQWSQVKGPKADINATGAAQASVDVGNLSVAVDTELVFRLTITGSDGKSVSKEVGIFAKTKDMLPILGEYVQMGGSADAVQKFVYEGEDWTIFNIGNKLCTSVIKADPGTPAAVYVPGFINDIDLVTYNGSQYALLACGSEGIVVVDITDPRHMVQVSQTRVNYYQDQITFAEGGGDILGGNVISSVKAPIAALETDGTNLFIADSEWGIHRTALTNLLGPNGPVVESDGTLLIDKEKYTLQFAGENPWGGPVDLKLQGGKLFACLQELGLGIFDPVSLEQVGRYNLYTDTNVQEDWFVNMDVRQAVSRDTVSGDIYVDDNTGMPDYRQASFEILNVMKNTRVTAPTPWADFDRYGKYYYKAYSVDFAEANGRTIAYIAYALGGLIAVDVTGYDTADSANFLQGIYLGYVPAVPANGPKEPTGTQSRSLLPYYGAGMLKDSGVIDVKVKDNRAYISDHFAGLVIVDGAYTPETSWKGVGAPYNNDTDGILGNHWPDTEFVTSYDMSPYDPLDNESMPKWMYQAPCQLVTAEINGHGSRILLMDNMSVNTAGTIDLLECAGAGGFNFVDLVNLSAPAMAERYTVAGYFPTTAQVGAKADGTTGQTISIGHTLGIDASDNYIYVSDGPHGVSAWKITDPDGYASDDIHLAANTLQDEYPEIVNGSEVYPASHASNMVYDPVNQIAWAGCGSRGLRKVDVGSVETGQGQAGNPLLLPLTMADCYEHNADWGTVKPVQYQDHAYDVEIRGNLAFVADGANGLTVYDITKDPTTADSGFLYANVGAGAKQPPLGTASGIALWTDNKTGRSYAFMACGPRGMGVVDITDPLNMAIIKVFEPIKTEEGKVGAADGQAVDVKVFGNNVYLSYDSFGVVCYNTADLIAPLPDGILATKVWDKNNSGTLLYDYRPQAVSKFKLQLVPGYEDWGGKAVKMKYTFVDGKLTFYVGYDAAGLVKVDWSDPAKPVLEDLAATTGTCTDVAISNGRLYVADGNGGLVFFK